MKCHLQYRNIDLSLDSKKFISWLRSNWAERFCLPFKLSDFTNDKSHSFKVIIKEIQCKSTKILEKSLIHLTLLELDKTEFIKISSSIKFDKSKLSFGYPQIVSRELNLMVSPDQKYPKTFEVKLNNYLNSDKRVLKVNDLIFPKEYSEIKLLNPDSILCRLGLTSKDRRALQERWIRRKKENF